MSASESLVGKPSPINVYLVRGGFRTEDVFYYPTDKADYWMMVPRARGLNASYVFRPEEDRQEWLPVGAYGDNRCNNFWITAETMAEHTQRITDGLVKMLHRATENRSIS